MNLAEIKLDGKTLGHDKTPSRTAKVTWSDDPAYLEVTITWRDKREGTYCNTDRKHLVLADDSDDLWSAADCLHHALEGTEGTRPEIRKYYKILAMFHKGL